MLRSTILKTSTRPGLTQLLGAASSSHLAAATATKPSCGPRCCLGEHATSSGADPLPPLLHRVMADSKPLAPAGLSRTFYKRQLPCPPAVEFSSPDGRQIFGEALAAGGMNGYFRLAEQFRTQDEPAFCGLASVAMVLNTLAIDPRRAWKGPWRFFHEHMLDCCHPLERVKEEGITLQQAACLARCNGAQVDLFPFGSVSLHAFRGMVADACGGGTHHLVVSYSRKAFLQTGDGHFSPIGGYCASRDMVLIMDTARFKYPPHWVPLEGLYNAMALPDPVTTRPRGFMRLGLQPRLDSVLFTLDLRHPAWQQAFTYANKEMTAVVAAAAAAPGATAESVVAAAAAAAPAEAVKKFVAVRTAGGEGNGGVCAQAAAIETFLQELRGSPLFKAVEGAVEEEREERVAALERERAALAAAAANPAACSHWHPDGTPMNNTGAATSAAAAAAAGGGGGGGGEGEDDPPGPELRMLSSHAAATSSSQPAVPGALLPERLALLLLVAPLHTWAGLQPETLRQDVLRLLDADSAGETQYVRAVVRAEVQYLRDQYHELPAMKAALEAPAEACASAACREEGTHGCGGCTASRSDAPAINPSTTPPSGAREGSTGCCGTGEGRGGEGIGTDVKPV